VSQNISERDECRSEPSIRSSN